MTAYEMRISDWSSDVCSSDLNLVQRRRRLIRAALVLQAPHIASKLFVDALGGRLEGDVRILRLAMALEHEPLHHMRDDIALEAVVRSLSEDRVRADRARGIFVGNRVHPVRHMRLTRFAGFDLVARDADFTLSSPSRVS